MSAATCILFTCDRRVFFEDDERQIREATAVERVEALLELLVASQAGAVESDDEGRAFG